MITLSGRMFRRLAVSFSLVLALSGAYAQVEPVQTPPSPQTTPATSGTILGIVKAGNMPIPGAAVSISSESSSQKISTWTDVDGSYAATVPSYGSYTVVVQMVAFANSTQHVVVDASHQSVPANFELTLLSRTHEATPQPRRPAGQAAAQRGFQTLSALQNAGGQDASSNAISDVVPSGMPVPGIDPNSATESIAVSGNTSNPFNSMSGDELQQRINDARQQGGGFGARAVLADPEAASEEVVPGEPMTITGRRGFDINHPAWIALLRDWRFGAECCAVCAGR